MVGHRPGRLPGLAVVVLLGGLLTLVAAAGAEAAVSSTGARAHHAVAARSSARSRQSVAARGSVRRRPSVRTGHGLREFPTALNVALTGTASASTDATGSPAANAIDGDASTQWCSTKWTGSLTVDLGSAHTLNGLGLTLGSAATTALVNFSYGSSPDALQPVPGAQRQTPGAGEPVYWRLSRP
jgi:hypothetical protein